MKKKKKVNKLFLNIEAKYKIILETDKSKQVFYTNKKEFEEVEELLFRDKKFQEHGKIKCKCKK